MIAGGAAVGNGNAARRGAGPGAESVVVVTKLHCTLAVFWLGFKSFCSDSIPYMCLSLVKVFTVVDECKNVSKHLSM